MTNKKFRQELMKWAIKFGMSNFYFCRNDRICFAASVGKMKDGKPYLEYNLRFINEYGKDWHSILFHEFGHIIKKHYLIENASLKIRVKKEYEAELFSYKMMKKYFPKRAKGLRKKQLEMINDNDWAAQWPVHQEAFKKVYK